MEEKKNNNNGRKICKICNRCFASGKAMGGHMRSHFAKLPIPPKPIAITPTTDHVLLENSTVGVDGGSTSTQHSLTSSYSLTIHPKKNSPDVQNFRSLNRDFSAVMADSDNDQESESDQSYSTRRRSKRCKNFIDIAAAMVLSPKTKFDEDEPKQTTSSIFDALFPAIEAARSLVMLSKDKWPEGKKLIKKKQQVKEDDLHVQIRSQGGRFECEICSKVFGSYQALGGHKASHKKFIKNDQWEEDGESNEEEEKEEEEEEEDDDGGNGGINSDALEDPKGFKCPHCSKVFESGQALGGHKKVHFHNVKKFGVSFIDLNLPALGEDIEEDSQIELSTVSSEDY